MFLYNLNLTFKPEFSYENLVLFVLLNKLSNKEAVKSAGPCFFFGSAKHIIGEGT